MKINLEDEMSSWENSSVSKDNFSVNSNTSKAPTINQLLSRLPKPQNKYEIDIIDDVSLEALRKEDNTDIQMEIEDEEDKNKRIRIEQEENQKEKFLNQSQVIQRGLLRPLEINKTYESYLENKLFSIYEDDQVEDLELRKLAEGLIKNEMMKLLEYDSINHPQKGTKVIF